MRIFFLISQSCVVLFSYIIAVLYEKEIWYPSQNILNADEWLIEHEGIISVIDTIDHLHMLK